MAMQPREPASCHSPVPSLLNRKLEGTCWMLTGALQAALRDMTPASSQKQKAEAFRKG